MKRYNPNQFISTYTSGITGGVLGMSAHTVSGVSVYMK
jgi:hypothetical protein